MNRTQKKTFFIKTFIYFRYVLVLMRLAGSL